MFRRSVMLRQTMLLSAANLSMRGISVLFQIFLADQLGPSGLGIMQLVLTVNGFALTIGTSGLRVASMYLSAEEYGRRNTEGIRQAMYWCLGCCAALCALVGTALFCAADRLALHWVKDIRAAGALRLIGLTLPVSGVSAVLAGYFTACGKVGRLAAVEIADKLCSVFLTAWLLSLGVTGDLSHACVSVIGGSALAGGGSAAVLLGMMLSDFKSLPPRSPQRTMGKRLLSFSVPVALNDYLRSGLGTLEQFLIPHGLSRSCASRTQALADYGTIHGMVFPLMLLPNTVLYAAADLLVPRLARCRAEADNAGTARIVGSALRVSLLFSAITAGFLFVLSGSLGWMLYNSAEAGIYLRVFSPLIPILYLDCIVDGMHKGLGQQLYCVRVNALTNLLDVIFLFLLLPRYGIGGYIFTYTLTHGINFCLSLRKLLQLTDLQISRSFLAKTAFCVCVASSVVTRTVPIRLCWSSTALRAGLYLVLVFLLLTAMGQIDNPSGSR